MPVVSLLSIEFFDGKKEFILCQKVFNDTLQKNLHSSKSR